MLGIMGMSGYMVVTVVTEEAVGDKDIVEDEHAMVGKDAVVDEEILAGGLALTVVVVQPLAAESVLTAAVVVLGAVGLPGAAVAECLSELAVCLSELAVCPLEAAVSRLLLLGLT